MAGADPAAFVAGSAAELLSQIDNARAKILRGDAAARPAERAKEYAVAAAKLQENVSSAMNGCAAGWAPDADDWIASCAAQDAPYGAAIALYHRLLEP